MPFAPADMYSATFPDYEHDQRRPELHSGHTSALPSRITSTQFFSLAALLFIASSIQVYTNPRIQPDRALPLDSLRGVDGLFAITQYLAYGVSDVLSPLMILSCTVAATGVLVRGLELVIQAVAFKGR